MRHVQAVKVPLVTLHPDKKQNRECTLVLSVLHPYPGPSPLPKSGPTHNQGSSSHLSQCNQVYPPQAYPEVISQTGLDSAKLIVTYHTLPIPGCKFGSRNKGKNFVMIGIGTTDLHA